MSTLPSYALGSGHLHGGDLVRSIPWSHATSFWASWPAIEP